MSSRVPTLYPAAMAPRSRTLRFRGAVLAAVVAVGLVAAVPPASARPTQAAPEGVPVATLTALATLTNPIALATRTGSTHLFVAERGGFVRELTVTGDTATATTLLDISGYISLNEGGGLLGLAFDPTGQRLYLHYTNANADNRLVEYTMNGNGTVNLATRRVVLAVNSPTSYHKGGDVTFGPDGRLYLALGDGDGVAIDTPDDDVTDFPNPAQDRTSLLGKILRINPAASATRPYRNPLGNPFVGQSPRRAELWAYGLRNPWRFSFDSATGDLYLPDVGEHTQEELNVLLADSNGLNAGRGANLGWIRMEGTLPFNGATEPNNHTRPTFTYSNEGPECAIIGGYVYRGAAIPSFQGTYLYGDRCTGRIGGIVVGGPRETTSISSVGVSAPAGQLQSFGQGPDGELYVLTANTSAGTGTVSRLDPVA